MENRIPSSARLEQAIADLVEDGNWDPGRLAELGRLGAHLVLQCTLEEVNGSWDARIPSGHRRPGATATEPGRAEYRRLKANGASRCPESAAPSSASSAAPSRHQDDRPPPSSRGARHWRLRLRAVRPRPGEPPGRGGHGPLSKSTASRICQELRERYRAFCARSLAGIALLALFLVRR